MSEQLRLVEDLPHARTTDPGTSWAAGKATEAEEGTTSTVRPRSAKHVALAYITAEPRTAIEVERDSGKRGIWKRVSDLKNAGLIEEAGTRRDPETHRHGIIWKPTWHGREVLLFLDRGEVVHL